MYIIVYIDRVMAIIYSLMLLVRRHGVYMLCFGGIIIMGIGDLKSVNLSIKE